MKPIVIDVHAHYMPPSLYSRFSAHQSKFPNVKLLVDDKGKRLQFPGLEPTRPIMPKLSELTERSKWMDANGIDHQLVGLWTDAEGYELSAGEGLAWSRYINDCMWADLRDQPRFTALASLPMQDGKLAAQVLREAIERGFGGVMIGTLPKGASGTLVDPDLDPFWQAASDLHAGIFLHPMFLSADPRINDTDMVNTIGRVAETTSAVTQLLYSGHLLKYPGVRLVIAHGGAALPYALGRLARTHELNPQKYSDPRKGFAALYFDSCVYDANAFEHLVKQAAPDRVMLGSDCPMPIADPAPTKVVEAVFGRGGLTDGLRRAILGETAQRVFRVRADCWCPQ